LALFTLSVNSKTTPVVDGLAESFYLSMPKTGNREMMASSTLSDTLRSFLCFLDGFYEERGQLVA
jgi:hypothetical protein